MKGWEKGLLNIWRFYGLGKNSLILFDINYFKIWGFCFLGFLGWLEVLVLCFVSIKEFLGFFSFISFVFGVFGISIVFIGNVGFFCK